MNGYVPSSVIKPGTQTVAGVQAGTVVTKPFAITAGGSRHMVIKIVASDVTVVGTITAKLQTAIGDDWVDSKTVAITEDGNFYIKLMVETAGDQTYLPLLDVGRVLIVNTNAGDTVTIDAVEVLQEL